VNYIFFKNLDSYGLEFLEHEVCNYIINVKFLGQYEKFEIKSVKWSSWSILV